MQVTQELLFELLGRKDVALSVAHRVNAELANRAASAESQLAELTAKVPAEGACCGDCGCETPDAEIPPEPADD